MKKEDSQLTDLLQRAEQYATFAEEHFLLDAASVGPKPDRDEAVELAKIMQKLEVQHPDLYHASERDKLMIHFLFPNLADKDRLLVACIHSMCWGQTQPGKRTTGAGGSSPSREVHGRRKGSPTGIQTHRDSVAAAGMRLGRPRFESKRRILSPCVEFVGFYPERQHGDAAFVSLSHSSVRRGEGMQRYPV